MAHIHEQIDVAVGALIVHQHRVLFVLHRALKRWLPVGGHVELNEDPIQALEREIREECGLSVEILGDRSTITSPGTTFLQRPRFLDIHDISPTHRHIGITYIARAQSDAVTLAAGEHDAIRWFSREDLNDPTYAIAPALQYYARTALDELRAS